jgi:hypothetical protein
VPSNVASAVSSVVVEQPHPSGAARSSQRSRRGSGQISALVSGERMCSRFASGTHVPDFFLFSAG